MPAQHYPRKTGLKNSTPRQPPALGVGGYDYPRGPYGATGFPGSTPASKRTKGQGPDGRKDPQFRGRPRNSPGGLQREWNELPRRVDLTESYMGGTEGVNDDAAAHRPKWPGDPVPSLQPAVTGRQVQPPARRKKLTTGPEHRMTPVIGADAPGSQNVRNTFAQRYKAVPGMVRAYRPAANPGKTGAHLDGQSVYHPGQKIYGHPDGKPIPAMLPVPGAPPEVVVVSRYVSLEGAQEGYAMNRELRFAKGGKPASYPAGYEGDEHLRGGRFTGQRYFGDLGEQQQIGLDSDSYGIARRRGPRHRPVRFEQPGPHTANYYDVPPDEGTQAPDMIHKSPGRGRPARRSVNKHVPARAKTPAKPAAKAPAKPAPRKTPKRGGPVRRG